jgi:CHAT domain-containing protein/Tfp pilus assembly protein PilF
MTQPLFLRLLPSKYRSWVVYCSLILSISLVLVQIQASPNTFYADNEVKPYTGVGSQAQENQQPRQLGQLELGKPIERELTGDQSHSYQMTLAAGQWVKLVIDQRGIDVVVKLFGPDGKQITEFDSESRTQAQETVSWVTEAEGSYQVGVRAKYKNAAAGAYEIRLVELRAATEDDRALHDARKLNTEHVILYSAGKYDEARPLVERILEISERVLGPEHPTVARALYNLALLYYNKGDYARAELHHQRALTIREKSLEPEHPDVAASLNNLALLYSERGSYAKAEQLYGHALTIWDKSLGPEHPHVAAALGNLANVYSKRGDYAKAELLSLRALNIWEKVLGPEHLDFAASLSDLATIYAERGDYAKAESLFQRALIIGEKAVGLEHRYVNDALINLAILYKQVGNYAKAEQLYKRALAIKQKVMGLEHPNVARNLTNFAALYQAKGDYTKAGQLLQQALTIQEKVLGPQHPDIASTLNNLAILYKNRGDYGKAEPLYQRTLAIEEEARGPEHPVVAESLHNLAVLYAAKGDITQAITFSLCANDLAERNFALILTLGSERQKLLYLDKFSKQTDFTLWLHNQVASNDSEALNLAFTTLLRRKGRGLDVMTDTIVTLRSHATPEDQALFDKLADARSQLAALTLKGPDRAKPDTYSAQLKQFEDAVEKLEGKLSSRSAEFRKQTLPVTLTAVQAALPTGSTLIEFAIYSPLDPKTQKRSSPRYLAYLLPAQGQPKWVDLGEAATIDRAVDAWRKALRDPNRTDIKRLARALDEKVMRPVRSLLNQMPGDTRRLLIAPDGSLNLIPFAALVDERNRYLVERYSTNYLTSGRDLLRLQTSEPSKSAPLVLANPLFGTGETGDAPLDQNSGNSPAADSVGNQAPARNDPREVFFQALPGTRREALAIKALLPEASLLLREDATEAALKQAHAPSILHIATHGFFLDDQEAPPPETRGLSTDNTLRISDPRLIKWAAKIENPLLRSGLALAGVNKHQGGDDDGLLTAMEAASLDLWGTKLVVLSACDTGIGKVKNGEGVYGLRRALVLAGSESQVISLWPVSDRETRGLMAGYYRRLQKGEGRGEALRQIQLEMLKGAKLRHPYYWASFIQAGEWANLDGKR